MIVVESIFFDSDDYAVESEVIPCDDKETAKAVVKKIYKKILEDYEFDDEDELKEWEHDNVRWENNGGVHVIGGDCGYAEINIIEKEPVSMKAVEKLDVSCYPFY